MKSLMCDIHLGKGIIIYTCKAFGFVIDRRNDQECNP